jgi:hypothetical protein
MNNMIDVAHAVFPKHSPGRLTTRGKFGTAVFSDVNPEDVPSSYLVQPFSRDTELISGELQGVHFECVAQLNDASDRYTRITLRMHVSENEPCEQ